MMDTPICDFVRRYAGSGSLRLHMPGHKGVSFVGAEPWDITEIPGADSLYEASGIIRESEENASRLFGCPTFYSAEGSSQCIRAMLWLARLSSGKRKIAAGRNAHRVFLSAAALLDLEIDWLIPESGSYLSCAVTPEIVEAYLREAGDKPAAVYLTSPDYLGNILDIGGIAEVCRKYGVMLLVDGAHGAYLRFLPESLHPMDLGADMCAASAHKTLPVLTGGAYLHISADLPEACGRGRDALAMFGSTSPSYLILQSLDMANRYLADHPARLAEFLPGVDRLQNRLADHGLDPVGDEPLKITLRTRSFGYTGTETAKYLAKSGIVCEFADPDHLVLMLTPEIGDAGLRRLGDALAALPRRSPITQSPPGLSLPKKAMSVRDAAFSPAEEIPVADAVGRILAAASVGCPPAVPIAVCGEVIDEAAAECFRYYGIGKCVVVKE